MKGRVFAKQWISLSVLLLLLFSSNGFTDGVLAVPEKFQEQDQWCWAGASQAIFEYYGIILTQTQIAQYGTNGYNTWNYLYGSDSEAPYYRKGINMILNNWGLSCTYGYYTMSLVAVRNQIDSARPFVIRWGWYSGGGHFVDGRGIEGSYVYYMDPWPGEGYNTALYSWVVDNGVHEWTHSLELTSQCPFPHAPNDLTANGSSPSPWTNDSMFVINWSNPLHPIAIVKALYKLSTPPNSDYDTTGSTSATPPDTVFSTTEGSVPLYLWLVDSNDSVNYDQNSSVNLRYDASPVIESTTVWDDTSYTGPFEILTKVTDSFTGVDSVILYYRRDEDISWISNTMNLTGVADWYVDTIPVVSESDDTVRYYIEAADLAQPANIATDPSAAPANHYRFIANVTPYPCGDCNGDAFVNFADALYVKNYYYQTPPGSPAPIGQGDVNLDGQVNFADALYIKNYYYQTPPGSPPPCEPTVTAPFREKSIKRSD